MDNKPKTNMSNAERAEAVFKPGNKTVTDAAALDRQAFDNNRDRLRAERLAREAEQKHQGNK